jgi:hypothetical protein
MPGFTKPQLATLRGKVKSRKQAIAIGSSKARKKGKPKKKSSR